MKSNKMYGFFKKLILSFSLCIIFFFIIISLFVSYNMKSTIGVLGRSNPGKSFLVHSGEGFFIGKMDEYGFNNDSFEEDKPFIFFFGDSYTEAFQLQRNQNYVSLINDNLEDYNCYNYGMSGNSLADYIYNAKLPSENFNVVFNFIEVKQNDFLTDSQRDDKLIYIDKDEKAVKTREYSQVYGGIVTKASSILGNLYPFFRYTYLRLIDYLPKKEQISKNTNMRVLLQDDKELIKWELEQLKQLHGDNFALIFISSIPSLSSDGIILESSSYSKEFVDYLFNTCDELDIDIIDTTQSYIDFYITTKQLPRGFNNTKPGYGHINGYGHEIIAELVINYIKNNNIGGYNK